MFLIPFIILFVVFRIWPIAYGLRLSLYDVKGLANQVYIGAGNYVELLQDPEFHLALSNSSYYTGAHLLPLLLIPMVLAILLFSSRTKGRNIYRTCLFLPVLTSLVVVGVVFRLILSEEGGLLNGLLQLFGLPARNWLLERKFAIPVLIGLATWRWTGVNIVYFLSGLATIPNELYEAASIDGASRLKQLFCITLPLLKPVFLFVLVISIIGGYQLFTEVYTLWNQGSSPGNSALTMVLFLYRNGFSYFKMGYASTIGVILALIIFLFTIVQFRIFGFFRKD